MKPPPRTRNKPNLSLKCEQETRGKDLNKWKRGEQKKLLAALKSLSRKTAGHEDIDYSFLENQVSTRSISEINSVVESLKKKVISGINSELTRKRLKDQKNRKPIEEWTHMASAVVGTLEEPISAAFTQMLVISSTEPRTLRNSTIADRPVGSIISCSPLRGESPGVSTAQPSMLVKTGAPTIGPVKRPSALFKVVRASNDRNQNTPQQQLSATAGTSPAATCSSLTKMTCSSGAAEINVASSNRSQTLIPTTGQLTPVKTQSGEQTTQELSKQLTTTSSISTLTSDPSSPHTVLPPTPLSSASSPVSTASCCSSSTSSVPTLSIPAAATPTAESNSSGKYVKEDKSSVDFEKIYRYLSVIHKPDYECRLTPMESAIILNLLMSLPEELPLLDCTKLHQHFIQMHQCLTLPAKSKRTRKTLEDLKDGLSAAQSSKPSGRGSTAADSQQQTARTGNSSEDQEDVESLSPGSNNGENQSGKADKMGFCPPLNPFMVPLKLLMRK